MAVKKYLKFDSEKGYLENKADINYFATNQLQKVAFGRMLGDFDENGLYVINKKIVEELIKMPKVIVEMVEESDLIRSKVKVDAFFHFILTVEGDRAYFKLLEKIHHQSNRDFNSGVYSDINEYVLDEVTIPDKDFDRNALYQKYNISTENDGEVLSIFDMDELSLALYFNIIEKLKFNYLVQNQLMLKEKEIESIEADYFEAVLTILGEFADFGQKVREGVQNDLAEKHNFVIVSKPFFQKTVNEVLDSQIEMTVQELSPEQKEQFLIKLRDAKEQYYQKFKTIVPIEISKQSGVRLDSNQIADEELKEEMLQTVKIKGFVSSDVRKIVINQDELQLSIDKIKEIVSENEEICVRDNAKARDITTGRKNTAEFYKELESKKKTDILTSTPLIKTAIDEKSAKVEETKKSGAEISVDKTGKTTSPDKSAKSQKKPEKKQEKKQVNPEVKEAQGQVAKGGQSVPAKGGNTNKKQDKTEKVDTSWYGTYSDGAKKDSLISQKTAKVQDRPATSSGNALSRLSRRDTSIVIRSEATTSIKKGDGIVENTSTTSSSRFSR